MPYVDVQFLSLKMRWADGEDGVRKRTVARDAHKGTVYRVLLGRR